VSRIGVRIAIPFGQRIQPVGLSASRFPEAVENHRRGAEFQEHELPGVTMPTLIARPAINEYSSYYGTYIDKVTEDGLIEILDRQHDTTMSLLRSITEAQGDHRYAPGKWSVKEVIGHLIDSERIFTYRALRFARGDATPLPGFEQDDYVPAGKFGQRSMLDLATEYHHVRQASLVLFRSLDEEALARRGIASGVEVSVRALAYIVAGHERHHVEILRTRYLA
jgi:uncharacterized damage-inducible protein DinB